MDRYAFRKFENGDWSLVIQVARPTIPYTNLGVLSRKTKGEKWTFYPAHTCGGIDTESMTRILAFMEVGK